VTREQSPDCELLREDNLQRIFLGGKQERSFAKQNGCKKFDDFKSTFHQSNRDSFIRFLHAHTYTVAINSFHFSIVRPCPFSQATALAFSCQDPLALQERLALHRQKDQQIMLHPRDQTRTLS
jgi:hypothetical protein